ncbi:MAG: AbrB/MazE/SpoVT family DNA-binding domain-containing protein, partial [Nanoarchaeota archaeon]
RLILFMIIDTTKMSSRGQVVIPLDMREDIKEGDKLIVIRKDNEIILKKSIPESVILSEKSFAKTWLNKKEDEAWKDL